MKKIYQLPKILLAICLLTSTVLFASEKKETLVWSPAAPPPPSIQSQTCTSVVLEKTGTIPSGVMWYWQGTLKKGTNTSLPATSTYTVTATGTYYIRAKDLSTNTWSVGTAILVTVGSAGAPTWYADTDGDGLGDPNTSLVQCTQPTGYVSNSDDQCPTQHGQGASTGCPGTQSLSDYNYVYTIVAQVATTDIDLTLQNDRDNVSETVNYFDGLGRAMQSIGIRQSPNKKDIVTQAVYDQYGRQLKEYLPYASTANDGYFKTAAITATENFYNTSKYQNTLNPYSEKVIEPSPLGRIYEQTAPGNDWVIGSNTLSKGYSDGHTIKFEHLANGASEVRKYIVTTSFANNTYTPSLTGGTAYYPAGELTKSVTKDENWDNGQTYDKDHTTEEFKNKNGQIILKRTYNNNQQHDTYYVYDDYGNLTYVLPPKAEGSTSAPTTTVLSELCYQYKYDHRNRLIEKKIPGKGWEYIVYDNLDRPVLTQDAIQAGNHEWLFTKYDQLGRVAYTGIYDHGSSSTRAAMQSSFDSQNNLSTELYETKVTTGTGSANTYYTQANFPSTNTEILTINYYDNYYFDLAGASTPSSVYSVTPTTNVRGLATGAKVRVLGTSNWATTVNYYDDRARAIYVYSKNDYLGTTDIVQSKLHFTGRVEETTTTHVNVNDTGNGTHTLVDVLTYDHTGRLLTQTQNINGGSTSEVIVSNNYDELGQLESKGVGGLTTGNRLQTVDYTYNVRGWLTNINQDANNDNDLFNFSLRYNDPTSGTALFNGNISQASWNTLSADSSTKTYTYSYDALNRILSGIDNTGNYNLTSVSYDKNGNILNLQRKGHTNAAATTFGNMDILGYTYTTNSNQLTRVTDTGNTTYGFKDGNTTGDDYTYDANGNMVKDFNKEILGLNGADGILYNHLNLPTKVIFNPHSYTNKNIEYVYDATGVKLRKIVNDGAISNTTDYAGNFIYEDNKLQFFSHAEGYVKHSNTNGYEYVYQYKDHLGNVRLSYADSDNNGSINAVTEIVEESNYYPFGLKHHGYNNVTTSNGNSTAQKFKYNGQEYEESLGLDLYEMDVRMYDPAIARFNGIDPVVHYSFGTSVAFDNNPVYWADPSGANAYSASSGRISWEGEYGLTEEEKARAAAEAADQQNQVEECPECDNPDILYDFVKSAGRRKGQEEAKEAINKVKGKHNKYKSTESDYTPTGETEPTMNGDKMPITGDESVICYDCGRESGWYSTGRYEFDDTFTIKHKGKDYTFDVRGEIRTYENKEDNVISRMGYPENKGGFFNPSQPMIKFYNNKNKEVARLIFKSVTQMNNFMSHYFHVPRSKAKARTIREYNESIPSNRRKN